MDILTFDKKDFYLGGKPYRIIAGDICSTAAGGFVHGFSAER